MRLIFNPKISFGFAWTFKWTLSQHWLHFTIYDSKTSSTHWVTFITSCMLLENALGKNQTNTQNSLCVQIGLFPNEILSSSKKTFQLLSPEFLCTHCFDFWGQWDSQSSSKNKWRKGEESQGNSYGILSMENTVIGGKRTRVYLIHLIPYLFLVNHCLLL